MKMIKLLLLILIGLNIFDTISTIILLQNGMTELNPILRYFIEKYGLETLERHNLTQDFQLTIPISKKPIPTKHRAIYVTPAYWLKNEFFRPCPKRVGEVIFVGPGLSTSKMKSRLRIIEGIFEVEIHNLLLYAFL